MKKFIPLLTLLLSIAMFNVSGENTLADMSDDELNAKLTECIENCQPQSAEPLYEEAISRAKTKGDALREAQLIASQIRLDCERMEESDYYYKTIDEAIDKAQQPVRQLLCLDALRKQYHDYYDEGYKSKHDYAAEALDDSNDCLTGIAQQALSGDSVCDGLATGFGYMAYMVASVTASVEGDKDVATLQSKLSTPFVEQWRRVAVEKGSDVDRAMLAAYLIAVGASQGESADLLLHEMDRSVESPVARQFYAYAHAYTTLQKAIDAQDIDKSDALARTAADEFAGLEPIMCDQDGFEENILEAGKSISAVGFDFDAEEVAAPNTFVPLALSYRNIDRVTMKAYRLESTDVEKVENVVGKLQPVLTKEIALPKKNRLLDKNTAYAEIDGLPLGNYMIGAFDANDELLCVDYMRVSDLRLSVVTTAAERKGLVLSAATGRPLEGAKVNGKSTDASGFATVDSKAEDFVVRLGGDVINDRKWAPNYGNQGESKIYGGMVLTDRGIYRPGQEVRFKAVFYETQLRERKVVVGRKVKVVLKAYNGKELYSGELVTNAFGSVSGVISLPDDAPRGDATLRIGNESMKMWASEEVRIEEYKRRDNKLTLERPTTVIRPGDTIAVRGEAMSEAGLPVVGAQVVYTVKADGETVESDTLSTDATGGFVVDFVAGSEERTYAVDCKMTDLRGETLEERVLCRVTKQGMRFRVNEIEDIKTGEEAQISIEADNLNGAPLEVPLDVRVYALKGSGEIYAKSVFEWEYRKAFDTILVEEPRLDIDGRLSRMTQGKQVARTEYVTKRDNAVSLPTKKLAAGQYRVVVKGKYADGSDYETTKDFAVVSAKDGASAQLPRLVFDVPSDIDEGSDLSVRVGSGLANQMVTVVVAVGSELLTQQVVLSEEVRTLTFDLPDELDCTSLSVSTIMVRDNRMYTEQRSVDIRREEPKVDLHLTTQRDKSTPGAHEQWTLAVTDTAAEVVASMYDARLDKFVSNAWSTSLRSLRRASRLSVILLDGRWDGNMANCGADYYSELEYEMPEQGLWGGAFAVPARMVMVRSYSMNRLMAKSAMTMVVSDAGVIGSLPPDAMKTENADDTATDTTEEYGDDSVRSDFRETVFFEPHLTPDAAGSVTVKFDVPDNITSYVFRAVAHTPQMALGKTHTTLAVSKSLMIQGGLPRFVTEGDELYLAASVSTTSDDVREARCTLTIVDEASGLALADYEPQTVSFAAMPSAQVRWQVRVPDNATSLRITLRAETDQHSDVEINTLPVVARSVEVPESHTFTLIDVGLHTLANPFNDGQTKTLTFTYNSNTFMEVVRALPHLDKQWSESVDTYIGRIESSAIAMVLKQNPDVRRAADYITSMHPAIADAELTPWYRLSLELQKHDTAVVCMLTGDYAERTLNDALDRLAKLQQSDGSFVWFSGMPASDYLTTSVAETLGRLRNMQMLSNDRADRMLASAAQYLKKRIAQIDSDAQNDTLANYALSRVDMLMAYALARTDTDNAAFDRMLDDLAENWTAGTIYNRVTIAELMLLAGRNTLADTIIQSLRENLVRTDHAAHVSELDQRGWYMPLLTNARLVMLLSRYGKADDDRQLIANWLIMQKKTDYWPDRQSTAQAVLALVGTGEAEAHTDVVSIGQSSYTLTLDKPTLALALENTQEPAATVQKSGKLPTWGSWQRVRATTISDLTPDSCEELSVARRLSVKRGDKFVPLAEGERLSVGDVVRVSISLTNTRSLSFVSLTDHRAAAFEPRDVLSSYRGFCWWRGGTPHYFSPGDTEVTFYIYDLERGTHTFEYDATVTLAGRMTDGYAEAQCLYAPEVQAHSAGSTVGVE